MRNLSNRTRVLVVIAILALVLFAIVLTSPSSKPPSDDNPLIVATSPGEINKNDGPVVIKTTEPMDNSKGRVVIKPFIDGEIKIIDDYIIFWPSQEGDFADGKGYTATFSDFKTVSGVDMKSTRLSFKTDDSAEYTELQKEVLSRYGRPNKSFLGKLPYVEPYSFNVSLLGEDESPDPPYYLLVRTLAIQGRNETAESYDANTQEARKAAIAWLESQGVKPGTDAFVTFHPDVEEDDEYTGDGGVPTTETEAN